MDEATVSAISFCDGQMSERYTSLPSRVLAERFVRQVDVRGARESIRHHQRRTGEIIRLHLLIDPAFKIPVAREHRRDDQIVFGHGLGNRIGQGAAVADARRAAVAHRLKAQLVERFVQPRPLEVIRHDPAAGGQAGFDPGLSL